MNEEKSTAERRFDESAEAAVDRIMEIDESVDEGPTGEIRPFIDTLRVLDRGELLEELDRLQHELVAAVGETHRDGKITIEIAYKLSGKGQIGVRGEIKSKVPAEPRGTSVFFVSPEGNLVRDMPGQGRLFGRD